MKSEFKGSPLMATLTTTQQVEKFYYATERALLEQPDSKFWKEAFDFIETRFKKIKNPIPKQYLGL